MKKLLLYILTILLFKSTLGQQCYMALYRQIPDYITPPIFGLDLNGGIVKIEFKNGNSITLKEYYKIDEISTLTPACDNDISAFPKTDILLHGLNAND